MLKLGTFIFDIDDYPSELPIGGSSLVNIERYPGGRKSIQFFGAFDDAITLQGTFRYNGALTKTRMIDAMWRAGKPVQFTVSSLMPRWVLITSAKFTYKNDFEIDYAITMERTESSDLNSALYVPNATTTVSPTTPTVSPSLAKGNTVTITAAKSASKQQTYVFKKGDTLWQLAQKYYKDGSQYTKIMKANNIKNPSNISVGKKLVIP